MTGTWLLVRHFLRRDPVLVAMTPLWNCWTWPPLTFFGASVG